jgi:hypothetical protein
MPLTPPKFFKWKKPAEKEVNDPKSASPHTHCTLKYLFNELYKLVLTDGDKLMALFVNCNKTESSF